MSFWDHFEEEIPDESPMSLPSDKNIIYLSEINENRLVLDKGSIKSQEKLSFIETLEKEHFQSSLKRPKKSISLIPTLVKRVQNHAINRHKTWNPVKNSITVWPNNCFGPKIESPVNKKQRKGKKKVSKKESTTSIKTKKTLTSSSKRMSLHNFTGAVALVHPYRTRWRSRLERIPEAAENDPINMTIMDL